MVRIDMVVGLLHGRLRLHGSIRVHRVAQLLRWLEEGNSLGRNINLSPGLRVSAWAGVALPGSKAPEAANLNLVPGLQGSDDGVEECVDDNLSVATGEVAYGGDLVYEVCFSHCVGSFRSQGRAIFCRIENSVVVDCRRDDGGKVCKGK